MTSSRIETFLVTGFGRNGAATREEILVRDYFRKKGFNLKTSREISAGASFLINIVSSIKKAQAVIVLLNKERLNVAFESGIIFGNNVALLPASFLYLADKDINIDKKFSDLKDIHWISYRKNELPNILSKDKRIRSWIISTKSLSKKSGIKKRKKILKVIQKFDRQFYLIDKNQEEETFIEGIGSFRKGLRQCL